MLIGKNDTKKALKNVKSIENVIPPDDPCTNFFGAKNCVLNADMMLR